MFCPNCSAFVKESELIKSNVKRWDKSDIEYDARCPACNVEIGHMYWGKLTVHPALARKLESLKDNAGGPQSPRPAGGRPAAPVRHDGGARPEVREGYCCPHCGGELPGDLSLLPRKRFLIKR